MKYLTILFLSCILLRCNIPSTKTFSARELNDSALAITDNFKDTSKFEQAIALLNKAIKQDSTIYDLYKHKYFFEVTLGDYRSALKTNNRLIAFRPDSADLYFQAATFEEFFLDTIRAKTSFTKAALLYKATLDTMNAKNRFYFYNWKLMAWSMIMSGHETIIHDYLRENCTSSMDSAIYNPEILGKTKQELHEFMNQRLLDLKTRH